jgi:hypothetical protein
VRRERLLMAQRDDHLRCRWCVGRNRDEPLWESSTCSRHRERLRAGEVAHACFDQVRAQARARDLLADEPCTVDGTLLEAWAGQKRCKRKTPETPPAPPDDPGTPSLDFRGERRPNAPPASTTEPEARLDKKAKGQAAKLASGGPVLLEHRHGVVVAPHVTPATGTAERGAALTRAGAMPGPQRVTLGAAKNDDTRDFVRELRERRVTPHVAQTTAGRSRALAGRTTRQPGYAVSQRQRQGVAESCGWLKTGGLRRQSRYRGLPRVGGLFTCAAAVYTLVRMRTLAAVA